MYGLITLFPLNCQSSSVLICWAFDSYPACWRACLPDVRAADARSAFSFLEQTVVILVQPLHFGPQLHHRPTSSRRLLSQISAKPSRVRFFKSDIINAERLDCFCEEPALWLSLIKTCHYWRKDRVCREPGQQKKKRKMRREGRRHRAGGRKEEGGGTEEELRASAY